MPIYEYTCRDCGKQFEQLVRTDNPPECPSCNGHRLQKLLSAFAVNSEGGGESTADEMCGRCGNAPGSCMMN
jgi:putative FmdB family regulatory protein